MSSEELILRLRKMKQLADKGSAGERLAAENLLLKVARKYGIDLAKFDEDNELRTYVVRSRGWRLKLMCLLAALVCGENGFRILKEGSTGKTVLECSQTAWLEICSKFLILEKDYVSQLDLFYDAFLMKNDLLLKHKDDGLSQIDKREIERAIKARMLSNGMTKSDLSEKVDYKRLEDLR